MTASATNTIQLVTWDNDTAIYDPASSRAFPPSMTIYDSDGGSYSIPFDHNIDPTTGNYVFEGSPFIIGTTTQGWYLQATDIYYPPGGIYSVDAVLCSQYLGGFSYPVTDIDVWHSTLVGTYGNYVVTAYTDEVRGSVSLTYHDIFGKLAPITRPVFYYDIAVVTVEVSDIATYGGVPSVVISVSSAIGGFLLGALELCPLVAPDAVLATSTYTHIDNTLPDGTLPYANIEFDGTYYYMYYTYPNEVHRTKALGTPWEMLPYTAAPADAWVSPGSTTDALSYYNLLYAAGDVALWEEIPSAGGPSTLVSADALGNTRYRTSFASYTYLQAYATNTPLFWGGNSVLLER